jgi:uncharacterized protein
MHVTLRPITTENREACLRLRVRDDQHGLIRAPVHTLAQAERYPRCTPLAVYAGDLLVGMIHHQRAKRGVYWIYDVLIDQRHQGRGFGRAAVQACIALLHCQYQCREVKLAVSARNLAAQRLYSSIGFVPKQTLDAEQRIFSLTLDFDPISSDPPVKDMQHPPLNELVQIDSDGATLYGTLYVAQGGELHPTVLLLHGFPGVERNLDLAQILRRAGWNALVFHYRGAWGSEGAFSFGHVLADVGCALKFLRDEGARYRVDPKRVVLLGHSMGGWAALMAGAHDPHLLGVGGMAAWNIGVLAQQAREDGDQRAPMRAWLAQTGKPLQGTSGTALLEEMITHADAFELSHLRERLRGRKVLLAAGSEDEDCFPQLHHTPLVRAFQDAQLTHTLLEGADHGFTNHRVALARVVLDWLGTL